MVRHAGAIYAMATFALEFDENSQDVKNVLKAVQFMKDTSVKKTSEGFLAVFGMNSFEYQKGEKTDKVALGGVGLGLVALLSVERLVEGTTPAEELYSIGEFILFMQNEDGGFYSRYSIEHGRDDSWTSLYYPGEAALGLTMLYEYSGDTRWLQAALKALGYLANLRMGKTDVEPDHWALLASERLWPLYDELDDPVVSKQAILEHAIQIAGSMLQKIRPNILLPSQVGCFSSDGITIPTSSWLEGLQAALTFIPQSYTSLRQRIQATVQLGIQFLIHAQMRDEQHTGMMLLGTRYLDKKKSGSEETLENFNEKVTEFRIDYVQHAQGAFMAYWKSHFEGVQEQ